jgi:hypothetical protein
VGGQAIASDVTYLDPKYRPERSDNVTVTLQRQISQAMSLEVGYVGRRIRNELQARNLDAVPYMTTLGGQTFADAYAKTFFATPGTGTLATTFVAPAQPFFETALGGANSAYCAGYVNCTSAVTAKNTTAIRNTAVSDLWSALYRAPGWTLGRSMISAPLGTSATGQGYTYIANTADGYSNYNALFLTYRVRDFHGVGGQSNFTWGRALGTGATSQATSSNTALDVYEMQNNYGPQSFDIKFIYNAAVYYSPKWFRSQKGAVGRVLGGWTISPLFTAQSGNPRAISYIEAGSSTGQQAFGEVSTASSATTSFTTNAQGVSPFNGGTSANYNVPGSNGVGTNNPSGVNQFSDPSAVLGSFRKCVLGFDQSCAGYAIRGLPRWNLDLSLSKNVRLVERVGAELSFQFTNILNHVAMGDSTLTLTSPTTFGRITGTYSTSRQMEFGLRVHF